MRLIRTVLVVSAVLTLSACTNTPKVQNMNMKANALYQSLQKKTVNIYKAGYQAPAKSGTSATVLRQAIPQAQPLQKASFRTRSQPKQTNVLSGDTMNYVSQQPKAALPLPERISNKEQHFINYYYGL